MLINYDNKVYVEVLKCKWCVFLLAHPYVYGVCVWLW